MRSSAAWGRNCDELQSPDILQVTMTNASSVDYSRLKILCMLEGPGQAVLTETLKRGTQYAPPIYLDEYLKHLPATSTAKFLLLNNERRRKVFNPLEIKQIKANPMWDNFDITLLYKCIQLACEDVADVGDSKWKDENEMEGLIHKLKQERNICVHGRTKLTDQQFHDKVSDLKDLYDKALDAVKVKYSIPDSEIANVRKKIHKDIKDIMEAFSAKQILQMSFDKLLPLFKEDTRNHLKEVYEKTQFIDVLYFLSGSPESRVNIQTIFCKVDLQEKAKAKSAKISCLDILKLTQSVGRSPQSSQTSQPKQDERPQLIMISGVAGSGKTTLLTFILSEWLKDDSDRRMKCLDGYDIVLQILCREREGPCLQDLLNQKLSDIFIMFNDLDVRFLTKCKVLFLIDGLDELNDSSDQLLNDILKIGKNVPGFTLICTSRPERVGDFLAKTRENYQQWETCMKGIDSAERTDFVLKHYDSLSHNGSTPHNGSTSRDTLRQTMESIGWRDYFGLPLNLLFLATLFHDNPKYLDNSSTQSNLYLTIHEWCVEKIKHRLARNPQKTERNRQVREVGIKRVLGVVYQIALEGLLQGRISLSEKDIAQLKKICDEEKLPSEEFLGGLFSLKSSITKRIVYEKYYVPHKGFQEFFAAQHIVRCLQYDLVYGDIRHMLQHPQQLQLRGLQDMKNMLLHIAALLSKEDGPPNPGALEEVVDLLAEAGVKKCEEWLSLVEETEVNKTFLQRVAHHITNNYPYDKINITDSTVISATALLPLIPSKEVVIQLRCKPENLTEFSRALNGHTFKRLHLKHHYMHPSPDTTSDSVLRNLPRNDLTVFMGQLSADGLSLLPKCLTNLHLSVADDEHTCSLLTTLTDARHSFPQLEKLHMHIPLAVVTPDIFSTVMVLPGTLDCAFSGVRLVLTDMDESQIKAACTIAAALQPREMGYRYITFPGSGMAPAGWRNLLINLAEAKVRLISGITVSESKIITDEEKTNLNHIARTKMKCFFKCLSEDALWWQ